MRSIFLILALLVFSVSHAAEPPAVAVVLADGHAVDLSPTVLAPLPRQKITGTSHGKTASYEGYDLRTVLSTVGVAPVDSLRGKQLATYLIVTAADGYQVVFGLAELDRTLGNTLVLLIDSEDGQPLSSSDGPWRLVVPDDQRPARWVRQVVSIRVVQIEA